MRRSRSLLDAGLAWVREGGAPARDARVIAFLSAKALKPDEQVLDVLRRATDMDEPVRYRWEWPRATEELPKLPHYVTVTNQRVFVLVPSVSRVRDFEIVHAIRRSEVQCEVVDMRTILRPDNPRAPGRLTLRWGSGASSCTLRLEVRIGGEEEAERIARLLGALGPQSI